MTRKVNSVTISTIGIDYELKKININDKRILKFQIWDTPGQERFIKICKNFIGGANGIILIYDITDKYSLEKAKFWLDTIRNEYKREIPIILVGNKIDLEDKRVISTKEGMNIANDNHFYFYESSAKNGINIDNIFNTMFSLLDRDFRKFNNFHLSNFHSILLDKYLSQ